jgi:hypothetical protein
MTMTGVFVNWTKPFVERKRLRGHAFKVYRDHESDEYTTTDQELLFTILSVGYWKKFNGPTKLYTDKVGFDYYRKNKMLKLWDEIDVVTLENYDSVDAGQFWTSAKSFAIGKQPLPFVFLDLDFIVRQKLPDWVFESKVTIPYWEIPRGYYYPTKEQYESIKHWKPKENYAFNMLIPNTSFIYLNDESVQKEYLEEHLRAVNTKDEIPEWFWLVTDQGLFGQSLRNNNVNPNSLTDKVFLAEYEFVDTPIGKAEAFFYKVEHDKSKDLLNWHHVWFQKIVYNFNEEVRVNDCKNFYQEILSNLSEYSYMLDNSRLDKYK